MGRGKKVLDNGRFVTVLIDTLNMPTEIGDGIAACVETARRGLFDPLRLPTTVGPKAPQGALGQPSFGTPPWGLPGEVKIYLSMWDRQGGHRIPALEATDDLWDQALSALRAGAVDELQIYLDRLGADGFPDTALGGASLDVRIPVGEGVVDACEIVVNADLSLFGRTISSSVQEYFVSLLRRTAVTARASTGYITLDASPDPYERRYGLNGTQGRRSSGTRLRGYYWANILSERHIQALGGMDEIRTQAPCHVVEDLSDGRETLAYLQLTPDMNRFDDEKLRALRDYLSTLLTPPRRRGDYLGPRLRVVE
jgi:hypothetical protein